MFSSSVESLNFTLVTEQDDGFSRQEVANQRTDSPLQQFNTEWLQKMHSFNDVLGQTPTSLQNPQDNGLPGSREKLDISKETVNIINAHRKYVLSQQHGQGHLQSMQQQLSQIPEVHSLEYQLNPQRPTTNFQGLAPIGQLSDSEVSVSVSSFSGVSPSWQNLTHPLHHGSNFDPRQENSISSPQQVGVGPQHPGISTLPSERAAGTAASANTMTQTMVSRALLSAGERAESVDTATTTPVAAIKPSSKAAVNDEDADTTKYVGCI